MKVVARCIIDTEIEINDEFEEINNISTAKNFYSEPLCEKCESAVEEELRKQYPNLSIVRVREVYSLDKFYTLFEKIW